MPGSPTPAPLWPAPAASGPALLPTSLGRALVSSPAFQARTDVSSPEPALLNLPEKAVQFGTGAFLRGFVEFFVDSANRQGLFNGRIVTVGSTGSGRDAVLNAQDGLYTLAIQGVAAGAPVQELRVIGSVSRALSARDEWDAVLECARNPSLEIIFSNTTEVGIAVDDGDAFDLNPPRSFPGKLTRFLWERAHTFAFDPARAPVVVPCELIEDNGHRLRDAVLSLASKWALGEDFGRWIRSSVRFCNTLVDRIVPGAPTGEERGRLIAAMGYDDAMLTCCEPYRLFAIEGDDALKSRLAWAAADAGIVVTDDVAPYRERKVRLLNGTHTAMVSAALLAGLETVGEAIEDEKIGTLTRRILFDEIVPTLDAPGAAEFAAEVMDRFANPFVRHALWDITLQATMKARVRLVPSIRGYAARFGGVPRSLAFGFAAFLHLMRGETQAARRHAGLPVPADDGAEALATHWSASPNPETLARAALADTSLWGADLAAVPGFADAVAAHLDRIAREGAAAALDAHLAEIDTPITESVPCT